MSILLNRPVFQAGIVEMVQLRSKDDLELITSRKVTKRIIELLDKSHFFTQVAFHWINFIYRYGEENKFEAPELGRISKKYGDLPVTVEIASDWIEYAAFNDEAMLEQIFESTALYALIYVGKKYKLPVQALEERLKEIGGFPELPKDYYEKLPPNVHRIPKDQLPQFQK